MSFTKVLFYLQWALLALMVCLVISYRFRWLPFKPAFGGFAISALLVSVVALMAIVLVGLSYGVISKEARPMALGAFLLGLLPLVVIGITVGKGFKVPRIHDISTNTESNIEFIHARGLRDPSDNSLDFPESSVVEQQKSFYANIRPLEVVAPPSLVFNKSLKVATDLGWEIVYRNEEQMQFEAVDKTAIFEFADDIVIRVTGSDAGSTIDMRSVSRVGVSDLGANAKRIERFQARYDMSH